MPEGFQKTKTKTTNEVPGWAQAIGNAFNLTGYTPGAGGAAMPYVPPGTRGSRIAAGKGAQQQGQLQPAIPTQAGLQSSVPGWLSALRTRGGGGGGAGLQTAIPTQAGLQSTNPADAAAHPGKVYDPRYGWYDPNSGNGWMLPQLGNYAPWYYSMLASQGTDTTSGGDWWGGYGGGGGGGGYDSGGYSPYTPAWATGLYMLNANR